MKLPTLILILSALAVPGVRAQSTGGSCRAPADLVKKSGVLGG